MSWSIQIYRPAKDFVNKFNNDELDFIKSPNKEQQDILTALASAINSFEIQENELKKYLDLERSGLKEFESQYKAMSIEVEHIFSIALSNLNRWIKTAKANNLYTDSKIKKEIEEFNAVRSKIEGENENLHKLNEILSKESIRFREGLVKIFDEFPETEAKYGWLLEQKKIEESKID